jgi:hypothetical protein
MSDDKPDYITMTGREFIRTAGADVDIWTDAALARAAGTPGFTLDREWLRSLLDDAMAAARADERRRPVP